MQKSNISNVSERLLTHLRDVFQTPDLAYDAPLVRLMGGFETACYRFTLANIPDTLPNSLVLRLYPKHYGPNPATWEAAVQNSLHAQNYPVARVHHVCTDLTVLGGAFILMDLIPGIPMGQADPNLVPSLQGTLHADLHSRNPEQFRRSLRAHGIDPDRCIKDQSEENFHDSKAKMPWLTEILDWMQEHPPLQPERLAACHGDFHPLNILVDSGQVTGVLDWGAFAFADPNYDIGNTLILITVPLKYLASRLEGIPVVDTHKMVHGYLDAYQRHRAIDFTSLDYYQVRRCVLSLIQGAEGQEIWKYPPIVSDLLAIIREKTGIAVELPLD